MTEKFEREHRYLVIKYKDIERYLGNSMQNDLFYFCSLISEGRITDGKDLLEAVVVENDWPEYEKVWEMIENRATNDSTD